MAQSFTNLAYPGYYDPDELEPDYGDSEDDSPGKLNPENDFTQSKEKQPVQLEQPQPFSTTVKSGYEQPQLGYPQPKASNGQPELAYMQPQPMVVLKQPGLSVEEWMGKPSILGVPPGLEYLAQIDQLLVHKTFDIIQALTNLTGANRYHIKNFAGQKVYYAVEDSSCLMRCLCGSSRGFTMQIKDNLGNEVMRVTRDYRCCAGSCGNCVCSSCCGHQVIVEAPVGTPVGYVQQTCSFLRTKFTIYDASMDPLMTLDGHGLFDCCSCHLCHDCCSDIAFPIKDSSGSIQGAVINRWRGMLAHCVGSVIMFRVAFPMDLDVKAKATCIGALFLIDFLYYEHRGCCEQCREKCVEAILDTY